MASKDDLLLWGLGLLGLGVLPTPDDLLTVGISPAIQTVLGVGLIAYSLFKK